LTVTLTLAILNIHKELQKRGIYMLKSLTELLNETPQYWSGGAIDDFPNHKDVMKNFLASLMKTETNEFKEKRNAIETYMTFLTNHYDPNDHPMDHALALIILEHANWDLDEADKIHERFIKVWDNEDHEFNSPEEHLSPNTPQL